MWNSSPKKNVTDLTSFTKGKKNYRDRHTKVPFKKKVKTETEELVEIVTAIPYIPIKTANRKENM